MAHHAFLRPNAEQLTLIRQTLQQIIVQIQSTGQFDKALKTRIDSVIQAIYGF